MKAKDMKAMSAQELEDKIHEMQKELMKLNTQVATGTTIKNSGQIKNLKKTIATMRMTINQKETERKT